MGLPYVDPSLPSNPSPVFSDVDAARGDHLRANNNAIWANLNYLDSTKIAPPSGATASNIAEWDNTGNPQLKDSGFSIGALVPIGSIVALLSGYFTGTSNYGYTPVVQALPAQWHECDGSVFNNGGVIYNGGGRYLPKLTDSRFLMGSSSPGGIGGQNSTTLSAANLPTHSHTVPAMTTVGNSGHYHSITGHYGEASDPGQLSTGENVYTFSPQTSTESAHTHTTPATATTGTFANTALENRPLYLSCKYIQRVA